MNCQEAEKRIYIYPELSQRERDETDVHTRHCAACRKVLEHVTLARSIAMSSSPPAPADPEVLIHRIMNAVHTTQRRRTLLFPRVTFPRFDTVLRYGMATLSLSLIVAFFAEYSSNSPLTTPTKQYATETEKVELNTAAFSRALAETKGKSDGGTSLYECVVHCLRTGDETCSLCSIPFSKPK